MTIRVKVENMEDPKADGAKNLRVHRVFFTEGSAMAEDGIIVKPGESTELHIWNNVRLAVEEEYEVAVHQAGTQD